MTFRSGLALLGTLVVLVAAGVFLMQRPAPAPDPLALHADGIGPLRLGRPYEEAAAAARAAAHDTAFAGTGCFGLKEIRYSGRLGAFPVTVMGMADESGERLQTVELSLDSPLQAPGEEACIGLRDRLAEPFVARFGNVTDSWDVRKPVSREHLARIGPVVMEARWFPTGGSCYVTAHYAYEGSSAPPGVVVAARGGRTEGLEWRAPVTVATGPARIGPWRMNESEFHYVDDATVALGLDGTAAVAWADNERQDIFFQRFDAADRPLLETPVNVSRSSSIFSWLPRVRVADDAQVHVLWEEIVFSGGSHGGEIFYARSTDGGAAFSRPKNLSNTTAGAGKGRLTRERWDNGSLDLALGEAGEVFVAWTEYEGPLRFRRSGDGGETFSAALHVGGSRRQPARAPSLAVAPGGIIYLAWTVGEAPAADIHVAVSTDNGRSFGPVTIPSATAGHSDKPDLAVDSRGRLHLVYAESADGPFTRSVVVHLLLDEDGSAASDAQELGPADPGTGGIGAMAPSVAADAKGNVFVAWEHQPDARTRPRGLAYSVSRDGGQSFSTPAMVPGSAPPEGGFNGSLQGQLARKLAVNRDGQLAVSNSHFLQDRESRVVLVRSAK
jgi:hypothetical protein